MSVERTPTHPPTLIGDPPIFEGTKKIFFQKHPKYILILTGPALAYLALSTYFESKRNNLCAEVIVKSCIFRTGVVLFGRKFFLVKNIISLLEAEIVLMAKSGVYN